MHFEYVKGRKGEGENPPSLKLRRSKKATVDRGGGEWGKKRRRGEEEKRRRGDPMRTMVVVFYLPEPN
jgi:hypothetical protein